MNVVGKATAILYSAALLVQLIVLLAMLQGHEVIENEEIKYNIPLISYYNDPCEYVNILMYVSSYTEVRQFASLVKSITAHSKSSLYFHVISADEKIRSVVSTLMKTWLLPSVAYTCYSVDDFLDRSRDLWATPIDKVIVLDLNVIFIRDISELWDEFRQFGDNNCFATIEPSIERFDQTGNVVLIEIETLSRFADQTAFWENILQSNEQSSFTTKIMKAIETQPGERLKLLACKFNVDVNSHIQQCVSDISDIVSFNMVHVTEKSLNENDALFVHHFNSIYDSIVEGDGNLLRNRMVKCPVSLTPKNKTKCSFVTDREQLVLRSHMFYLGENITSPDDDFSISMAMQTDFSRFVQMIDKISVYWTCPMSITIYATDEEARQLLKFRRISSTLSQRKDISIHISYVEREFEDYPVNHLRNVAQEGATTQYIFITEIDYFYSLDICQNLQNLVSMIEDRERTMDKKAIVVPAFESNRLSDRMIPETKEEIVDKYLNEEYHYFHHTIYPGGHKPTNYERWIDSSEEYRVRWNRGYEPYLVLKRKHSPEFPKIFSGRGYNKGSHVMRLVAQGYELVVSPDTFMVHMPHWVSDSRRLYLTNLQYQRCLSWAKVRFDQQLYSSHNITERDMRRGGF
ncbi:xylosyl- and glucuronyltransferase LARGE2s-like [Saccoglossus kowalevskii]|uniref:Glycosyltransferase-like protein LARGE2-like n=1 Tax=Saccoglossus kowalevskii TaxID=10224 RepID=A0ABM0GZN4_SACKO|nr:PREDICTED: glycosyltransferase-like protein LARGE2-like [Saccoglossus kowalevskii]